MPENSKSFNTYVEDPSIKQAIEDMTRMLITLVVEGESEWRWLQRKLALNAAKLDFQRSAAGGKSFVITQSGDLMRQKRPVVGLIDRDLDGWTCDRNEAQIPYIFDTECVNSRETNCRTFFCVASAVLQPPLHRNDASRYGSRKGDIGALPRDPSRVLAAPAPRQRVPPFRFAVSG